MPASGEQAMPEGSIRVLDPFRDLKEVVELISLAFGERLDPAGRATLERMRRFARSGPVMQWLWAFLGRAAAAPGLVWVVDGEIVGNVSLRRSRGGNGYLIGNVVVHPDHRGQGIGGAMMRRAIRVVSRRGAPWVGLEVRADNEVARTMYDELSFYEVGRTHHMIREHRRGRLKAARPQLRLRRGGWRDADGVVRLMERAIPEEQRPLLEKTAEDYRPGWARRIDHWLRCEDEVWWVAPGDDGLQGAVRAVRKSGSLPHRLEVLVAPGIAQDVASALARRGLTRLSGSKRPITSTVPGAADCLLGVLRTEGFREMRVLVQMKRDLKHRVPVKGRV